MKKDTTNRLIEAHSRLTALSLATALALAGTGCRAKQRRLIPCRQ